MHRESIVHSMVEMVDGSLKAHLSAPDMRQPILYALTYPERLTLELPPVDFARLGALHFGELDRERYPCMAHALEAGRRGGTYPAAVAAADEEGVSAFLDGRLRFLDIPNVLADTLEAHHAGSADSLDEILQADAWARSFAQGWIKDHSWT
jgi:1-deoxy-D-xylulose-5-phosphate reductoisomerase